MPDNAVKGEEFAAKTLERNGYRILARNYRTRFGEIDVVAQKGEILAFVEVKTRSANALERPAAAVNAQKRRRLIAAAEEYIQRHPGGLQPRFDVFEVLIRSKEDFAVVGQCHLEGAFEVESSHRSY
jgi:putative endonuclease